MLPHARAAHLHCLYCGGERRADDSACRKCQAEAPSVPCKRCKAQVFAPRDTCICGQPCTAWVMAEPEDLACPRCHGKLEWVNVEDQGIHVEQCARCFGCFVRTQDFSELVERESAHEVVDRATFVPPPEARQLPPQALLAEVTCPHCDAIMERARFAQKASIVVDVCPKHGVWLDAGELPRLLDYMKQLADGSVAPDAIDQADAQHWNEVLMAKVVEEQRVESHLAQAEAYDRARRTNQVIAGTVIGGPWVGLFMAMRNGGSRK